MNILYVTTISITMNSFLKPHVEMLVRNGHHVDIACNFSDMPVDGLFYALGCSVYQVDFSRSPLSWGNIKAYKQLNDIVSKGKYDVVHCHTPNASAITRMVCRKYRKKTGLKVFYTAHGFHFYKGAPKLNWMIFYPLEKVCSYFTDKLITINNEDFILAKKKFIAKEVHYVSGVGINLSSFENTIVDKSSKRRELGVPEDACLLVSVGELNDNKNHKLILQAMNKIPDENIHYMVVGRGKLLTDLQKYVDELGIANRVHFMGYRTDVVELYKASDVYCSPSYREGLPVALMEAMACGLPVVCSKIRGNIDLIDENGGAFFTLDGVESCCKAIKDVLERDAQKIGDYNKNAVKMYSLEYVLSELQDIYDDGEKIK